MRSGEAFQVFRLVDTIVMDKTGTLTEGKPQLISLWAKENNREDVLSIAASAEKLSEHPLAQAIINTASENMLPSKKHSPLIPCQDMALRPKSIISPS